MPDDKEGSASSTTIPDLGKNPGSAVNSPQSFVDIQDNLKKYITEDLAKLASDTNDQVKEYKLKADTEAVFSRERFQSISKKYDELHKNYIDIIPVVAEVKNERLRTIEMVSVFVALITFISGQVNIFKGQTIGGALAFDLILSGILITFVLLVHFVSRSLILEDIGTNKNKESKLTMQISLFVAAILLVGLGVYILQHESTSKIIGDDATMVVQPVNNVIQRR